MYTFDYAVKEIRRRKVRSIANVMGYIVAVALMIILVTFAQAYTVLAAAALRGIGTHFAVFLPAGTECPCELFEIGPYFKGVYTETFNMSVVEAIRALPGVEDAAPFLLFRLENLTIGGIDIDSLATNTTAVSHSEVVKGRYLEATDYDGILVDEIYAGLVGIDVGDNINAFNRTFNVVGIVNPAIHSKPAGIARTYALLGVVQDIMRPYSLYNYLIVGNINVVLVEIAPEGEVEEANRVKKSVLDTLESRVGRKGSLAGYGCDVEARDIISVTEENAWVISFVLIIAVTLFSLKSQFGAVIERTKEIGILKAIGWADSDVMKQTFVESVLQGLAGGMVGACLGYVSTFLVPSVGFISTENLVLAVSPLVIVLGLAAALIGGIVAGIFPAWRAAKLQPAEALRRF